MGGLEMNDLFKPSGSQLAEQLELPDATLGMYRNAVTTRESDGALEELLPSTNWREEEVVVWGKRHKQPRLVAWHGDPGAAYTYSGSTLEPEPWTQRLTAVRAKVQFLAGSTFNSVLLNLYRSNEDRMGWHSDDEPALGPNPIIASLSLGATRTFQLKHKTRKDLAIVSIDLTAGSLLVMSGTTQRHWLHSVKKESRQTKPRINLTFRRIFTSTR